jgi:thiamine biosynthesis lipoprotein
MLGTFVAIDAEDSGRSEAALHRQVDAAFRDVARVAALMSFHDPASELSRLNAAAHEAAIAVHPWTFEVLAEAIRLGHASAGAFDVAVAPTLVRLGFLPGRIGRAATGDGGSYRDVRLCPDGRVRFERPLQLDLGGIAKGFAVDRAAARLARAGVARAAVDAGGDIRFVGTPPRRVWVRSPRAPWTACAPVEVAGPAVATSAGYFAGRRRRGRFVTPILDPRTRRPVRGANSSISVFAPTALLADALTKVVAVAPPAVWKPLLRAENASAVRFAG